MSLWEPTDDNLRQLATVLHESSSTSADSRENAKRALEDARKQPDLDNYLTYLLVKSGLGVPVNVRATAGLLLKNNIRLGYDSYPEMVSSYIKSHILEGLVDEAVLIQNITGNVVTTLLTRAGITGWPEALGQLMSMMDNPNIKVQEAAMSALSKICEDSASSLDKEYNGERPLAFMIPKFLSFTSSPSAKVRSLSILCLSQFITPRYQAFLAHIDSFLNVLFTLTNDPDSDTRRHICTALVSLLEVCPDKMLPHLEGIIDFCLHCIKDEDEQVASEACEFILSFTESKIDDSFKKSQLPKILPVILSTMVYSESDRLLLESLAEDDETEADKSEDIKPTFAKSKDAHNAAEKKDSENKSGKSADTSLSRTANEEEDEDDDDDDDDDSGFTDWNLRKCSAATLDVSAVMFPETVLEVLIPHLRQNVVSSEWYVREAAILAFGAIAEGCMPYINQHLPELVPFLIERLSDEEAPVRQIACWTLGRYSVWISGTNVNGSNPHQYFLPCLENLLRCCLDKNKKVQESACSAIATFTDASGELLVPFLDVIVNQLMLCFTKYQAKNLGILCDALQTLVVRVPTAISEPRYVQIIVPPLVTRFESLKDDDKGIWPLAECLSNLAAAVGEQFAPYATSVFDKASRILKENLIVDQYHQMDPSIDAPEKDFVITSLDLLDGLIIGLEHHASELMARQEFQLPELMLVCFDDEVYEVRQSAFALLGDMAIYTFDRLQPYFSNIMRGTVSQIDSRDPGAQAVCNNAIWSVGEISLHVTREQLEPYAEELLHRLVAVLQSYPDHTVLENASITIGRLGQKLSDIIAPHVGTFIEVWCSQIRNVEETDEKDGAFLGMCQIIAANPSSLTTDGAHNLLSFLQLFAMYQEPSPQLAIMIERVLKSYQSFLGDDWITIMNKLHPEVAQVLHTRYGV